MDRAVKHLVDSTDFWNIRSGQLAVILSYLLEIIDGLEHWHFYRHHIDAPSIGVAKWRA